MTFLYAIESVITGHIKLGQSKKPRARLTELQVGSADDLVLLGVWPVKSETEKLLHVELVNFSSKGEWFILPRLVLIKFVNHFVGVEMFKIDLDTVHDRIRAKRKRDERARRGEGIGAKAHNAWWRVQLELQAKQREVEKLALILEEVRDAGQAAIAAGSRQARRARATVEIDPVEFKYYGIDSMQRHDRVQVRAVWKGENGMKRRKYLSDYDVEVWRADAALRASVKSLANSLYQGTTYADVQEKAAVEVARDS